MKRDSYNVKIVL